MHAEDHHHHQLIHDSSSSSQTPIHVMHSSLSTNNNVNSGSSFRGMSSGAGPSPSFNQHGSRPHVTSISLTTNNQHNDTIPSSSSLGHYGYNNGTVLTANSRNQHNNFRSVESTPPSTTFLLGGTPARASAVGPRGRSRTHLQPLDRAKTPVIADGRGGGGDESDFFGGGGGPPGNGGGFPVNSLGLEMVRGIGIANSNSPPLGMPRNLPPLEADVGSG